MKTIHGMGLLAVGLLLSACDTPSDLNDSASPPADAPIVDPPAEASASPFAGATPHVDSWHPAHATIADWQETRPADADLLREIARTAQAVWLTGGSGDADRVRSVMAEAADAGAVPVFVLYNVPARDCGGYSGNGGASAASGYRSWVRAIADGFSGRRSLVVLEPDALANMDCLSGSGQEERVSLIGEAVRVLEAAAAAVYIDAGHARWHAAPEMAARLERAGIRDAHGFSLNVSNYVGTSENVTYGEALSGELGGKGYVIDTSRNGNGATAGSDWCNPPGRALGDLPTFAPNRGHVHALLWIKRPGESDGPCNGGPSAGVWWPEYALGLAQRAV